MDVALLRQPLHVLGREPRPRGERPHRRRVRWPAQVPVGGGLVGTGEREQAVLDQVVFRSKQVVSTLVQAVHRYGYANFSRYCGTTPPGISRNAYGLLGSASVLAEMRGDIGQKSNGYIAKTAYVAAASVVEAL